ncbi:CDP-diacylglycerol--glycerol-3-phosphate 3-phosphatidyltransferase [Blastocladiella emersonii ATCC 22665]|nr:CDP-diacylglycerol--glycerol-3-phosphate 3-phosphatidyltransferase [Blastocladiella emersonii ATCC 22665]
MQRAMRLTEAARTLSLVVRDHVAGQWRGAVADRRSAGRVGYWFDGDRVRVLHSPADFYDQLKVNIRAAKRRIVLSALYIGHGERDLIDTLHAALAANPDTRLTILVDYLRGTRGAENSVTALSPLLAAYPGRVEIALYHTPELTGWKKRLIPQRFNETIGLLHFKLFATDDSLIISGANLSKDYFTNRQDRYMLIDDARIAGHYARLVETVAQVSFRVPAPNTIEAPSPNPVTEPAAFRRHARAKLLPALELVDRSETDGVALVSSDLQPQSHAHREDTLVVPAFQASPLGIHQEQELMRGLWEGLRSTSPPPPTAANANAKPHLAPQWDLYFTSGYFNMTPGVFSTILSLRRPLHVLTASPQANGFYGSRGVSQYVPNAYSWLEARFLRNVQHVKDAPPVVLEEYARTVDKTPWTFHAKGLWIRRVPGHPVLVGGKHESAAATTAAAEPPVPVVTVIGSSNFGHRSAHRDLEAQAIVVTTNPRLQAQLQHEVASLWKHATPVDLPTLEARNVHWLTKLTAYLTQNMF